MRVADEKTYKSEPIDLCQKDLSLKTVAKIAAEIDHWFNYRQLSQPTFKDTLDRLSVARKNLEQAEKCCRQLSRFGAKYGANYKVNKLLNNFSKTTRNCCADSYRALSKAYTYVSNETEIMQRHKPNKTSKVITGGANNILQDLDMLRKEFKSVIWNYEDQTLTVTTQDVILYDDDGKEFDFGQLKIVLYVKTIYKRIINNDRHVYRIFPSKNPLYSVDEHFFHPHVNREQLCEGEGSSIVTQTLRNHQLLDFFTVINTILNTYNSESPYLKLKDWNAPKCSRCSAPTQENNRYYCIVCDAVLCSDCTYSCHTCGIHMCSEHNKQCNHCGRLYCEEHITECQLCGKYTCNTCISEVCSSCGKAICRHCRSTCRDCGKYFCSNCKERNSRIRCPSCKEEYLNEKQEEEERKKEVFEASREARLSDEQNQPGWLPTTQAELAQKENGNDSNNSSNSENRMAGPGWQTGDNISTGTIYYTVS
jgi:hypothetical protein